MNTVLNDCNSLLVLYEVGFNFRVQNSYYERGRGFLPTKTTFLHPES